MDRPDVETLRQAMGNPVGAVKAANSKVFGLGKSMLSKTVDTTKSYGSLFARNPLTAVGQGTKGLLKTSVDVTKMTLMSPATVTQALSRKRGTEEHLRGDAQPPGLLGGSPLGSSSVQVSPARPYPYANGGDHPM